MSTKAKFCYGLIVIVAVLALWAVLHWWFELSVAEVIAAMVGVALATFAALTWLTYEKLAELAKQQTSIAERHVGLTNALESHSTLMLLIEAKRGLRPGAADNQPIRTVWWDPTVEKAHFFGSKLGVVKKHRDEIDLDEIRLNIPLSFRQGKEKV